MNRSIKLSLASFASALAFALVAAPAHAAEPTPDRPAEAPAPKSFKPFAVEANPLGLAIGHYSLQAEWLPAEHHAIVVNPHFDHVGWDATVGPITYQESFSGFGGELGYRYYTGSSGANGFFVGPSVLVSSYTSSVGGQSGTSFTSIGGALDVGGQWIVGPGIVIGAGLGLQYTKASADLSTDGMSLAAAVIGGGGVRPRALLSLGYAF